MLSFEIALGAQQGLIDSLGQGNAHLIMAMALLVEEPDLEALASEGLTDGGNDKKIDFIYHDKEVHRLVFAQGYFSSKNNEAAPANKASDLNTACAWLVSGDTSVIPPKLRDIITDCREAIENGDIDFIDLLYVHNLPESIGVARELQTAEEQLRKALGNEKILIKSYELGRHKLDELYATRESHIEVMEDVNFPSAIGIAQSGRTWKAGVATVSGTWVHALFHKYGDKLYSANYRGFLGADRRKRVNSGIRESAERTSTDFWAFNNGITILTTGIVEDKGTITLKGISVINGAQTTGSIGSVDASRTSLADVKLLCRIIECSDQETVDRIVRYNNTQNVITTWDQFSNDADQRRIEDEFKELGFAYNRKRGFTGVGEQVGIEQVLQPLLAYHGRSRDAVRGKNQLFVNKQLYDNAFAAKKARHILLVYTLARAIDTKRLELKAKSTNGALIAVEDSQLNLLRNLNFKPFLINVVANSLETIVGVPCDQITVGFKSEIAKAATVPELAARWIPVVEAFLPLLTAIVQPGTFFKNLSADDNFIKTVKVQMDAMLTATNAIGAHKTFSSLVAPS